MVPFMFSRAATEGGPYGEPIWSGRGRPPWRPANHLSQMGSAPRFQHGISNIEQDPNPNANPPMPYLLWGFRALRDCLGFGACDLGFPTPGVTPCSLPCT